MTRLLKKVIRMWSTGYKFMWGGKKGADRIAQIKENGGFGVCDFELLDEAIAIRDAVTLWEWRFGLVYLDE